MLVAIQRLSARSDLEGVLFARVGCMARKFGFLLLLVPVCLAASSQQKQKGQGRNKNSQLVIATSSPLPGGQVGTAYQVSFSAKGGVAPYSWSIASGSVPAGLALDAGTGALCGTPTASGSFSFVIAVADSGGQTAQQSFSLAIAPPPPVPLAISTTALPSATSNQTYSASLAATGGTPPYDWLVASGQLPPGLSLSSSGGISGTPTTSGAYGFTVEVVDSSATPQTASEPLSISVASAAVSSSPLAITTAALLQAYVPERYAGLVQVAGGTPGYTWTISAGQLPAGLTLSPATGEISGTPSAQGNFSFTVTVTDSSSPPQTASAAYSVVVSAWPPLDEYGGAANAPAPGGATGYFHIVKDGSHWLLVDPLGNLFWMISSYVVDTGDGGAPYSSAVLSKYGSTEVWAAQATARLLSWGFNTIGPQPGLGSHNVLPVSTYNASPNPHPMPFLRYVDLSSWCVRNSSYQVKNLYNGMNPAVFSVARTFPEVFDPNWVACAQYYAPPGDGSFTPNLPQNEPWMIGTWLGDADYLYGFGRGPQTPGGAHPHLGWIAATTSPTQSSGPNGDFSNLFTYGNTTVYTKLAWQSYLETRYGTIQALNAAWGSNYTTFGSAGGWPKKTTGGTGLMDEDGSSPWMGNGTAGLSGTSASVAADLNAFLGQIARQYFSVAVDACKTDYPNHLVFGPGSLNVQTYPQVLEAAGQYLDVVEVWVEPQYVSTLADAYNTAGKPLVVWTSLQAHPDSDTTTGWGILSSSCNITGGASDYDYTTQDLRGQCYQQLVDAYWSAQGADGSNPVVGLDWWEFVDKVVGGENTNFGLVDVYDNAYDGVEDQIARSADPWGYPVGGQTANYGNFIGYVQREDASIIERLAGTF
jgi:hypothetical protein